MAKAFGRLIRSIHSIFVPTTAIVGFSFLLTFFYVLYQPTRGPGDVQRLGWQSWDTVSPLSETGNQPPQTPGDHNIGVDWWNDTAPDSTNPVDSASLPLDVWAPLLPHDTGLSEIAVVRCMFDLTVVDMCTPSSSTSDNAVKGKWVRVPRDLNLQSGMWHLLLYYRRTRRRDVPLILDIQLLPPGVTPSGDGDWVKVSRSLRDGVVRSSPLFLWYLKGKTLQDISEAERQSLITELDVVYGDGDPWYGFERLSPPTTEKSARAESVSITMRKGVKPPPPAPPLHFSHDGRFKIMQIADLHFSVGAGPCRDPSSPCEGGAYAYTESLVNRALDEERPDLVVFTGDQLNGQGTSWDAASVLAKFAAPVISRRIPWAAVFGNHDAEDARGSGYRRDQIRLMQGLPYSLVQQGPEDIHGVGNYVLKVLSPDASKTHLLTLYFIDSGAYAAGLIDWFGFFMPTEYDYIHQDQIEWFLQESASINPIIRPFTPDGSKDLGSIWDRQQHAPPQQKLAKPNALMFFHIPLQESYGTADTDARTGLSLDVGTSDLERRGSAKKNGGFFENGLLHALETPHRGAGGIPEVKVVGNGHCHRGMALLRWWRFICGIREGWVRSEVPNIRDVGLRGNDTDIQAAGRRAGCGRDGTCGTGSTGAIRVVTICVVITSTYLQPKIRNSDKKFGIVRPRFALALIIIITMHPNFVQDLHSLLLRSTTNDTIQLKAATAQLNKDFYKDPACIPALAHIIANAQEIPVRQLAAIEVRKRVSANSGNLWLQVPQSDREQLKTQLPQIVLRESNALVRHSTARVIAAIAGIEMPVNGWPQLLPFLLETATSSQAVHREVGIYILYTVLETIVEGFQEHLQNLFKLFENLLCDPESAEVRVTTARCLGTIAQYIDTDDKTDIKSFQSLLPLMIQVLAQTLEARDEANARHLFDVFETLLILEIPLLSLHIPQLVQFFIQAGSNREIDSELRILALNALNWTVQYKKSKIQSNNLAAPILNGLMPITTEDEPEDIDDDAPARSALRIIDTLATSLPPTQVFPALRDQIQQYFSSPESSYRRGAMLALGVSVEGCSEYMTPLMGQVWPVIEAGLQDGDAGVRRATCVAVSCLCEWLEDECVSRHAVLVPAIMALVADPSTQRSACTALDALLEVLHDVIDQYLPLIMERLSGLLETAPLNVKAVVTGAIGSAAHASKDQFTKYFQETMNRMQHFLVLTGEGEETELRGITMDTVGTFAEAVGKDLFRPYYEPLMKQAFQGIELGSARLRECSFLFFGVMAGVFGEEFAPSLPAVVPSLIASLKQEESGQESQPLTVSDATAFASGSSPANAISVEDGTEEVEIDLEKALEVNSAVAVEKEIAADTLGTLFIATREQFLPFVEETALELIALLSHYYEGIRKSSTDSLLKIIRTFHDLSGQPEWQPGASVQSLNQNVKDLIDRAIPELLQMYEGEDNKGVASALCIGLAETISKIGPAFLENYYDKLCSIAKEILEQKAICQQDPDQDADEEAPEDQAEYDSVLISSAGDLVAAMANALGADFAPAFNTFHPLIAKYYKKSRSLSDRSSAIGCLAEIISGMKGAITPSTEPLLELLWRAIGDQDAEVQSNAAFATGLLVENSEQDLSPQYITLLGALQPLFNLPADAPAPRLNARDNACGAVARLILKNASAVPLPQVLPVLFGALPLRNDLLENQPVFRAVLYLFQTQPEVLSPYLDGFLRVFAHVLDPSGPDQVGDEVRAGLIGLIGALNSQNPEKIQQAGLGPFVPGG